MTSWLATAYSTRRARRYVAWTPCPPRRPLTPRRSSLSHTLSSLRLKRVCVHPRRDAASSDLGMSDGPVPTRLSQFSAKARMSRRWLGVSVTCPIVVSPASSRPVEETSYMVSGTVRSIS